MEVGAAQRSLREWLLLEVRLEAEQALKEGGEEAGYVLGQPPPTPSACQQLMASLAQAPCPSWPHLICMASPHAMCMCMCTCMCMCMCMCMLHVHVRVLCMCMQYCRVHAHDIYT